MLHKMCIQFLKLIFKSQHLFTLKLKFNLQCFNGHFIGIFQKHFINNLK